MNQKFLSIILAITLSLSSILSPIINKKLNSHNNVTNATSQNYTQKALNFPKNNENKLATQNTLSLFSFALYSISNGISFSIKDDANTKNIQTFNQRYQNYQTNIKNITTNVWQNVWITLSDEDQFNKVLNNLKQYDTSKDNSHIFQDYQTAFNDLFGIHASLDVHKLIVPNINISENNNPFAAISNNMVMPKLTKYGQSETNSKLISDVLKIITVYVGSLPLCTSISDITTLIKNAWPFLLAFLNLSGSTINFSDMLNLITHSNNFISYFSYFLPWVITLSNVSYQRQGVFIQAFISQSKVLSLGNDINQFDLNKAMSIDFYRFESFIWMNNFKQYTDFTKSSMGNVKGEASLIYASLDNDYSINNFQNYIEPTLFSTKNFNKTLLSVNISQIILNIFLNTPIVNHIDQKESFWDAMGVDIFDYYAKLADKKNPFSEETGELKFNQDKYVFNQLLVPIPANNNVFDELTSKLININKSYLNYYQTQESWFKTSPEIKKSKLFNLTFEKNITQLFYDIENTQNFSNLTYHYSTMDDFLANSSVKTSLQIDFKTALSGRYAPYGHFNINNPNYDPFQFHQKHYSLLLKIMLPCLFIFFSTSVMLYLFSYYKKQKLKNEKFKDKNNFINKTKKIETKTFQIIKEYSKYSQDSNKNNRSLF